MALILRANCLTLSDPFALRETLFSQLWKKITWEKSFHKVTVAFLLLVTLSEESHDWSLSGFIPQKDHASPPPSRPWEPVDSGPFLLQCDCWRSGAKSWCFTTAACFRWGSTPTPPPSFPAAKFWAFILWCRCWPLAWGYLISDHCETWWELEKREVVRLP